MSINQDIIEYNDSQSRADKLICDKLAEVINQHLPDAENKIWHRHPVWFLESNPIVGYSKQKAGIRLMFWSGQGFGDDKLNINGKKFKDASIFYNNLDEIIVGDLKRWLNQSRETQWDYKNIVKNKGVLNKL